MANIELRQRFIGQGLIGSVDLPPALSWSDQRALQTTAAGAAEAASELRRLNQALGGVEGALDMLGLGVAGVAYAVDTLERNLGLRLDAQSALLERQLDVLGEIHERLRTPARTRAAERVSQAGSLLARKRWQRAAELAEEAIEDDPTSSAAFQAAGWAALGMQQPEEARDFFAEAAEVGSGDARAQASRQAARLDLALEGPREALARLAAAVDAQAGDFERRACAYDRAVFFAESQDIASAATALTEACTGHDTFCLSALADDLLSRHPSLQRLAQGLLLELGEEISTVQASLDTVLEEAAERIESAPDAEKFGLTATMRTLQDQWSRIRREADVRPPESSTLATQLGQARLFLRRAEAVHAEIFAWRNELDRLWRPVIALENAVTAMCEERGAEVYRWEDREAVVWTPRAWRRRYWRLIVDDSGEVTVETL